MRELYRDGKLPIILRHTRFILRVDCLNIGVKVEDIADFGFACDVKPNLNNKGKLKSTFEIVYYNIHISTHMPI